MKTHNNLGLKLLAALFGVMTLIGSATAQSGGATPAERSAVAAPVKLPPSLQRAIESGNETSISNELKKMKIATRPGTPPRHECGTIKCSCSGAEACSTIAAACKAGTLGCNDESCICDKK